MSTIYHNPGGYPSITMNGIEYGDPTKAMIFKNNKKPPVSDEDINSVVSEAMGRITCVITTEVKQ